MIFLSQHKPCFLVEKIVWAVIVKLETFVHSLFGVFFCDSVSSLSEGKTLEKLQKHYPLSSHQRTFKLTKHHKKNQRLLSHVDYISP